jgi:stage III sporulation protein AB
MALIKTISSIIIICSCTFLGFLYGKRYSDRVNHLIYLEQCIKMLETEIVYGATPLPEALYNVYLKGNKKISFIFEYIREDLISNKRGEVLDSFISIKDVLATKLQLKDEDIESFISLGRVLGSSDRQDQQKNFVIILNQIRELTREAKIEKDKNEKMFRNLGVLTGLAIVIILI